MRFPLLPVISFFLLAAAFSLMVIFFTIDTPNTIAAGNFPKSQGKVLGVSEKAEPNSLKQYSFNNSLPPNSEISTSIPAKKEGFTEPALPGCSSVVIDPISGKILTGQGYDQKRSIASITKLAAMLVMIETDPDWNKIIEIIPDDIVIGGRIYLGRGDKLSLKDLLYLSLVSSDNTAVMAMTRSTGYTEMEFVDLMNNKMQALGLAKTKFVDPVGISWENESTAFETAKLAQIALAEPLIQETTLVENIKIKTEGGRTITLVSTDDLLNTFPQNGINLLGGKTGYTIAAGYCFVGKFSDEAGNELISVVLGEDNIKGRFKETKKIVEWAYNNYEW